MNQQEIFQLKIASLIEANKLMLTPAQQIEQAETIYQWLAKEALEAEAIKAGAQTVVK